MWNGYLTFDGNEIVNSTRTEAYAQTMGLHWLRPLYKNNSLPQLLGDGYGYTNPLADNAPWVDPDEPASLDFCGLYPLDITGVEDSSRTSQVVESIGDGGSVGKIRHATKSIVFNMVIVAASEAGAEYGLRWLNTTLLGGPCLGQFYAGSQMCFLSSEPVIDLPPEAHLIYYGGDATTSGPVILDGGDASTVGSDLIEADVLPEPDCIDAYLRTMHKVIIHEGPVVTAKRNTHDGGAVWSLTFIAVAGNPYQFTAEVPIVAGMLDPAVSTPMRVPGAAYEGVGYIYTDVDCAQPVYAPVFDPLFPNIVAPPMPPSVPLGNFSPPVNWRRRTFTIPKEYVGTWGAAVPKITVHARTNNLRNLRLRFYADVRGNGDITSDPCSYCGDILISYVPVDSSLVFDAAERIVYVETPGGARRRADSLVFKTDGTPFDWPELTCGFGYVVTLDLPQTQRPPVVDLSLRNRVN